MNSLNDPRAVVFPVVLPNGGDWIGRFNCTKAENYVLPEYRGRARTLKELLPIDLQLGHFNYLHKWDFFTDMDKIGKEIAKLERVRKTIGRDVKKQAAALIEVDREVQKREEVLALATKAPSVKEMRAATSQLFKEYDLSPIKELIEMSRTRGKDALPARDRMALLKFLAEYEAPRPKSVDIQQDTNMNISVGLVDFRSVQGNKAAPANLMVDEDYDEFTDDR